MSGARGQRGATPLAEGSVTIVVLQTTSRAGTYWRGSRGTSEFEGDDSGGNGDDAISENHEHGSEQPAKIGRASCRERVSECV